MVLLAQSDLVQGNQATFRGAGGPLPTQWGREQTGLTWFFSSLSQDGRHILALDSWPVKAPRPGYESPQCSSPSYSLDQPQMIAVQPEVAATHPTPPWGPCQVCLAFTIPLIPQNLGLLISEAGTMTPSSWDGGGERRQHFKVPGPGSQNIITTPDLGSLFFPPAPPMPLSPGPCWALSDQLTGHHFSQMCFMKQIP